MLMLGKKPVSPGYFPFKPVESATNCLLEIPQNIKLEYNNGVVTLKAGSVIALTGDTYSTITTTQDITWNSSTQANTKQYLFITKYGFSGGLYGRHNLNKIGSGPSLPADDSTYLTFFNTTDKIIYRWNPNNSEWESTSLCYPLGIVEIDENGNITGFAKDSNGNDIIFNGFGFIGQTKYILPGVKMLLSAGKYNDGTNRNINYTSNSLQLSTSGGTYIRRIFIRDGTLQLTTNAWYYDNSTNLWYDQSDYPLSNGCVYLGDCNTIDGIVTNFTINPPLGYWRYFVKMIQ